MKLNTIIKHKQRSYVKANTVEKTILIQENEEVFHELWSKLEFVFESHLSSPGAPDHVSYKQHEDFIP